MSLRTHVDRALARIGSDWNADLVEDASIDFKQMPDGSDRRAPERFLKDLAESVVCFANGPAAGALVLGVKNRAATREEALVGVDTSRWLLDDLVFGMHERTRPSIAVRGSALELEGKTLYVLQVPSGTTVHCTTEGVYKHRLGNRCLPMQPEQVRGLRALRQEYDWSAEPSGRTWTDLSRAALERAAELLASHGHNDLANLALTDAEQFCRATQLATKDSLPTRAAVLLYGSPASLRSVPGWGVNLQSRDSPGGEPRVLLRQDETTKPLVLLLDELLAAVGALSRSFAIRVGAQQVELVDYPPDALREIFANAFAHRDWEAPGVVEVIHTPEELAVTSPGGLLPTLRLDRLLHDAAAPRNPSLARHMARLRLAELSGLGFDRAYRAVALLGKEPPILADGPRFRVTLLGGSGDESFARYVRASGFPRVLAGDVDVLMVLTALRTRRTVTGADISDRLQRSPEESARVLARMAGYGLLSPTLRTRRWAQPAFQLTPEAIAGLKTAVIYREVDIDADDDKLLRHLRRHGRISNEDVRGYLDCDTNTARNRLARLRKRGLIGFAPGSPRRGPHVVYVLL